VGTRIGNRHRRTNALSVLLGLLVAANLVTTERPALAASGQLSPVPQFGSNPGSLAMFEWIPADLPANAPVVVVLHGCFATAPAYDDETGWTKLAERWKVALVFPEQTVANDGTKCFRFWNPQDIVRGQGEALSIKQMIDWMHANRATDPSRVFVMGHSGGGLFTSVMLATYPDVFSAGAIVAGGPYRCGDEGAVAVGMDGSKSPVRGGECVDGSVTKTSQEWGDLARSGYPGYTGRKPRVSIWHGTADTMVSPKNMNELVKQWTNFNEVDDIPDLADTVKGYPHKTYTDVAGQPLVESYELTGQSHGWPYDPGAGVDECDGGPPSWNAGICGAYYAGRWFGLDSTVPGPEVPEVPYAALLPLLAIGVGGTLVLRRRRRSTGAAMNAIC
jgi:poly(hydroxyalkanoate) depolymerase family esterase